MSCIRDKVHDTKTNIIFGTCYDATSEGSIYVSIIVSGIKVNDAFAPVAGNVQVRTAAMENHHVAFHAGQVPASFRHASSSSASSSLDPIFDAAAAHFPHPSSSSSKTTESNTMLGRIQAWKHLFRL
jgi:hypothetical protein